MFLKIKSLFKFDKKVWLFLPYFLISIFLIVLPVLMIIISAFSPSVSSEFDAWVLVKEPNTWNIIGRSLWVGIVSALLCLIIGFPYAYFVSTSKSKVFKLFALSLIISPMAIFTIARIYSIKGLALAIFSNDPKTLNSELFIIFGLTYLNLPLMILPLYTVFKDMPKNIIEASNDLGYNNTQTMLKVIIPYGTKAILSGLAMIFLASATTFVISSKLLVDGSQHQLIGDILNSKINPGNKYDLSSGSALVIVVSAIFIGVYSLFLLIPKLIFKLKKGANYE
ncbi:ABC transporter permease [Mycoplasmopsis felis]|uniref:Spermidine/putrescine ABC transporter permease n=2 Tax=Mycoplasmopsis felis TaxID=33923 RepID=A0A809SIB8_9BACT|nr:ABC transporter permease [Mycoplasmopsis felis]WQQ02041.1 ABC transporter permease [Mycoplasmopsis felis]WQQ03527.1 ABC transporter permease [Mycoplasmopsis felis]WQQ04171.1 ABC transporter permease [Mycoplasmopsis felis]WQQ04443.1 ABC transporter permease [Mycoplasmopsis felis]WQQ05801.1 ABC transporter permease [Mycoplasmopsis felis]